MQDLRWLHYAILAAACAASINIFGKIGMRDIDPDFSTAVRSVVQALFVVALAIALGSWSKRDTLSGRPLALAMIVCSGVAGGLSWVFAFRALKLADVSQVAPIDKLSMPLGILLAVIILGERPTLINWIGILLIAGGAYLATWPRPKPPGPPVRAAARTPSPGTRGEGGGEGDFERQTGLDIRNHPHPNPVPEYWERGTEKQFGVGGGSQV